MKLAIIRTPNTNSESIKRIADLYYHDDLNIFHTNGIETLPEESFYIKEYEITHGYFDVIIFLDTALYLREDCRSILPGYNEVISTKNKTLGIICQKLSHRFFICDSITFHKLSHFPRFEKYDYFKYTYLHKFIQNKKELFYFYAQRLNVKKIENSGLVTRT